MVVTFTAGGSSDVLARAVADAMSRGFGKQVAVDNRPGAGGHIGAESVAHAAPDGYTIPFGTNGTLGIGPALYKNLRYDPERDLAPIGILARAAVAADQRLRRSQTLRNDRDGVLAAPGALPQRSWLNWGNPCCKRPASCLCGLNNQIEIDCASAINAPKITSGGTSRSDIRGIRRNVVRRSSYNNGAARPAR